MSRSVSDKHINQLTSFSTHQQIMS